MAETALPLLVVDETAQTVTVNGFVIEGVAAQTLLRAQAQGQDAGETLRRMLDIGGAVMSHGASVATVDAVEARVSGLLTRMEQESAHVAQLRAVASKVSAKGFSYEELLHPHLDNCFSSHLDVVSHTGGERGIANALVGDFVVTLNPADTAGADRRVVVEAKDKSLSMNKALAELDAAIENRAAHAGVLVFAASEQSPIGGKPLRVLPGGRVICVFDKETGDGLALEVACHLARTIALASNTEAGLDRATVADALSRLTNIIEGAGAVKRGLSSAKKGLESAEVAYTTMRDDALALVANLQARL